MTIPSQAKRPADHLPQGAMSDLRTLDEVAAYLRKTPAQMRWMRHNKTGPRSASLGGRVMYRQRDVDAWIDAQFEAENPTDAA